MSILCKQTMDVPVQLDVPFPARVFLWHCDSALIDRQVDDAMASMRQLALMSDSAAAEHVLAETRSNVQLYRFTETDKATPPDDPCLAPKAPMFGLPGLYEAIVDYPLSFVGFVLQYLHRQADGTPALSLSTPLADIVRASFQTKRFRYVFESAAYSLPLSPAFLKVLLCLPRWTQSEHVRGMVLEALRSLPADVCGKVLEDVAGTQECPLVTWKVLDGARYGERLTARQWSAAPNVLARLAECGKLRSVQHLVGPTASCPKPRGAAMTTLVADNASVTFRSVLLSELCGGLPSDDVLHHLMVTAMRNNADECVSVIMTAKPRLRCRVVNEETLRAFLTMDRGLQVMVLQEYNYMTLTSLLHSPAVTNEMLMTNALNVMGVNPRRSWFAVSLWVKHTELHPEALDSDDGCDAGDWLVRAVGLWDRFLDQAAHVLSCPVVMKLVERGLWSQLKHVGLRLPLHRWMVWPGDIVPLYRASLKELPPVFDFGLACTVEAAALQLGIGDKSRVATLLKPGTKELALCKSKRYRIRVFDLELRRDPNKTGDNDMFDFRVLADIRRCVVKTHTVNDQDADRASVTTTVRMSHPYTFRSFQISQTTPSDGPYTLSMDGVLPRFTNIGVKRQGLTVPTLYWTNIVPEPPATRTMYAPVMPTSSYDSTTVRRKR